MVVRLVFLLRIHRWIPLWPILFNTSMCPKRLRITVFSNDSSYFWVRSSSPSNCGDGFSGSLLQLLVLLVLLLYHAWREKRLYLQQALAKKCMRHMPIQGMHVHQAHAKTQHVSLTPAVLSKPLITMEITVPSWCHMCVMEWKKGLNPLKTWHSFWGLTSMPTMFKEAMVRVSYVKQRGPSLHRRGCLRLLGRQN